MHTRSTRLVTAGLCLGLGAIVLGAGAASAHVFAEETEVAAGAFATVTVIVPHGCEGSPTTQLRIQVPDSVGSISPQVHPGWTAAVTTEELDEPVEGEDGEQITVRTSEVTFTAEAGSELLDGFRDSFTIGYQAPETPGEHLFFKTIQICAEGQTEWIEEYTGEGEEPAHPSPAVLVTEASEGGDGHGTDDATDSSDSAKGIAIAGLVVGTLGLLAGGAALARSRRTPA